MRWHWLVLALSLTTPAWAGEQPPVKLGLVVPMAGEAGRVGQSMRQAAEMAVADWTEKLGRKVDLTLGDDQFDPRQAVIVAEKLVQEGVWGVVGHFYSSSSIPASAVYNQAGIPQVTPTSTNPRLTAQGFDNVFRVSGRDDQHALSAADFILLRLRPRRIAVIHDRTEYGRTLAETLIRAVERRGARRTIVALEEIAQGDKDFSALVARLKSLDPNVVYFGGIFREGGYLIRQMRQAGVPATFVSADGVLDAEFVKIAGEEAANGAYLTFAPDPRLLASARSVIQRFEARYGPMGPYVLYTYDAVGVLLHAIQAARPQANTKEELRKVLKVMHGMAYDGTLGRLRWDKNGDLSASPYVIYVTRKGGSLQGWFEQVSGIPMTGNRARPAGR
ncbi:MAG: branched-chain amino acid ABC transporter substrate-binding protein [candidate division NC10 bacterium]|nr:branched-chain amino acid ABC transporter substrate-binding protein [candidate division NC10 bacterium]